MDASSGLAQIAQLGARSLASSADAIAAVTDLVQRTTGIDITVTSEITAAGEYVFRGIEKSLLLPVERDSAMPYPMSMCSRVHAGESPATVPDTREVPALWQQWLRLKEALGVDWDLLAFCTRDIRLPDGSLYGTLCLHHTQPRAFTADEEALLEVLARLVGQEIWRERSARELVDTVDALHDAERRRVELAQELRHELRAPLQVIDGYAEAMLDGVVRADEDHLVLVRQESAPAMQLLDDLADLARLETRADPRGTATEQPGVAADRVVVQMRDRLAPLAESAGVELVADVVPATVAIVSKRLEQYVVNLVRNALRAVGDGAGTQITMFVRLTETDVEIGVEDDGPGIGAGELPRVFDRYYRGSSGRGGSPGSGLGLTIARRIVEAAGGTVAVEPIVPRGVRFVARFPTAPVGGGEETAAGVAQPAVEGADHLGAADA